MTRAQVDLLLELLQMFTPSDIGFPIMGAQTEKCCSPAAPPCFSCCRLLGLLGLRQLLLSPLPSAARTTARLNTPRQQQHLPAAGILRMR